MLSVDWYGAVKIKFTLGIIKSRVKCCKRMFDFHFIGNPMFRGHHNKSPLLFSHLKAFNMEQITVVSIGSN